MQRVNPIVQWWHGESLPAIYIFPPPENLPKAFFKLIRLYIRAWAVHPIKRRISKLYVWILQSLFGLKVIGISGSAGKTSAKEMLASILALQGKTVSSYLNIDSTFNIPTTILKCKLSTKFLVLEMGTEYLGDMKFYRWIVTPNIAIITNIFQTHTHFFKNVEGVTLEKRDLIKNLPRTSITILNNENEYTKKMAMDTKAQVVWFGKGSQIYADNIKPTLSETTFNLSLLGEKVKVNLSLIGEHFVSNALSAVACANSLGVSLEKIKRGLENTKSPEHRLTPIKLKNGAIVLDDVYNNNPSAAKATFKTLKAIQGKRKLILVYGDMKELGETEIERHKEIGEEIEKLEAEYVILVGPLSKHTQSSLKKTKNTLIESAEQVLPVLKPLITSNSLILFKGARSLTLEKTLSLLH